MVPNVVVFTNRMIALLRMIISGRHALVKRVVLRTDTAGDGVVIILLFLV